jgi:hypothetical protein
MSDEVFSTTLAVLVYVRQAHEQFLWDSGLKFHRAPGGDHIEFYSVPGGYMAVPIYDIETEVIQEFITLGNRFTAAKIDNCIKEIVIMVKRKRLVSEGPVLRRIKIP